MKIFHVTPIFFQRSVWPFVRIGLRLFAHLEIRGIEHVRELKSNAIFASNHTSELDGFIVAASVPFWSRFLPLYSVSRESTFYTNSGWRRYIYGKTLFNIVGAPQVRSGNKDYEKSLTNHIYLIEHGWSILIHPEGQITRDGTIQSNVRGGVAYLARRTGRPVIPVGISGAYHMSLADFFLRRRHIIVRFGEAITADELDISVRYDFLVHENIYKKEAEYMMERVKERLGEM